MFCPKGNEVVFIQHAFFVELGGVDGVLTFLKCGLSGSSWFEWGLM